MKVIAVTGLIGSGKSELSQILAKRLFASVFDCDKECRKVIAKDDFKSVFGFALTGGDPAAKSRFISDYVFKKPSLLSRYERYMWGKCLESFMWEAEKERQSGRKALVLDSPLLFQSGFDRRADVVVIVEAAENIRRKRFVLRGGRESDFDARNALQSRFFLENASYIRDAASVMVRNDEVGVQSLERAGDEILDKLSFLFDRS